MKFFTQKKMTILLILLLCSVCVNFVFAVSDSVIEPGSDQDPIVSKSYVDKCIEEVQNASGFKVVSIEKGQAIYTGSGTEIILRSGKANAIKGEGGGLSDTTAAKDLTSGMSLSINHLLVSAREDGRGIIAHTKCWLLVRGFYHLKEKTEKGKISTSEKPELLGTVTASILNIRAQPDTTAKIVAKLKKGDSVEISVKKEAWYQISVSGGVIGWLVAEYVDVNQ